MQNNKSKEVFSTIKTISKGVDRKPISNSIRNINGELLSYPEEVKQIWYEYGKALYSHQATVDTASLEAPTIKSSQCISDSEPAILRSEVEAAVKKLKKGKAPRN